MIKAPISNKDMLSQVWQQWFLAIDKAVANIPQQASIVDNDKYFMSYELIPIKTNKQLDVSYIVKVIGYTKTSVTSIELPYKPANNISIVHGANIFNTLDKVVNINIASNTTFSTQYFINNI